MKHKRIIILFWVSLLVASCIDPYPFDPPLPENTLVVDGFITDQPGTVEVRLSTAARYGRASDVNNFNWPVTDATVRLMDDTGNAATFIHNDSFPGRYRTTDIQGQVGRTYVLEVNWEGKTYLSRPETMPPPVPLDTVYAELVADTIVNERGVEAEVCSYEVRVNVQDPAGEANHYLWRYRYIHEMVTAVVATPGERCFVWKRADLQFGLTDDAFFDGSAILDFPIGKIPYHFWHPKYLIDVEQYSLTPEAYAYWKQIKQQQLNVGSIFDPPPSTLRGNVYLQDDTTQFAYGYFRASSLSTNYTLFSSPVNDCFRDFKPDGFCSDYPLTTSNYPPDPRWR